MRVGFLIDGKKYVVEGITEVGVMGYRFSGKQPNIPLGVMLISHVAVVLDSNFVIKNKLPDRSIGASYFDGAEVVDMSVLKQFADEERDRIRKGIHVAGIPKAR